MINVVNTLLVVKIEIMPIIKITSKVSNDIKKLKRTAVM